MADNTIPDGIIWAEPGDLVKNSAVESALSGIFRAQAVSTQHAISRRIGEVNLRFVEADTQIATQSDRIDALGSMAGVGPGDASDGTVSSLVLGATNTRAHMDSLYAPRFVERDIKRDFGAVGDGVTDDTAAFAAAMSPLLGANPDALLADRTGEFVRLHIPFGTYRVDPNTITWDLYRCVLDSQNAVFLVENTVATDWAMKVTSTAPRLNGTAFYNQMNRVGSFALRSATGRVGIGMLLEGVTAPDNLVASGHRLTAQTAIEKVVISGFHKGVQYGENSYMIGFRDTAFNDCNHFAHFPPSFNAGERLWFDGCTFGNQVSGTYGSPADAYANGYAGLWMEGDQSFVFSNCSFDWVGFLIDVASNSEVFFDQCHLETPHGAMPRQADVNAGRIYGKIGAHALVSFKQCRFLYASDYRAPVAIPYLFSVDTWGTLEVDSSVIYAPPPYALSWVQPGAVPPLVRAVTSFQAVPNNSAPMPALGAKATLSPDSWGFAALDPDWVFSGGALSGSLSGGAMTIDGNGTTARLKKPVTGPCRWAGVSLNARNASASAIVYVRITLRNANGQTVSVREVNFTPGTAAFGNIWFAYPFYRTATSSPRSITEIELEVRNSTDDTEIKNVTLDYWE